MRAGLQAAQTALEGGGTREELDNVARMVVKMGAEDLKLQAQEARKRANEAAASGRSEKGTHEADCRHFVAVMDAHLHEMRAETAESLSTSLAGARSEQPVEMRNQVLTFAAALKKVTGHVWIGLEKVGINVLADAPVRKDAHMRTTALLHELRGLGAENGTGLGGSGGQTGFTVLHRHQVNHGQLGVIVVEVRKYESADANDRYQVWWNDELKETVSKRTMKQRYPDVARIQSE
jgi:hypothetical protein